MEDAQGNIDALNKGAAALSWQTTGDSSKGIIRDVTYTSGKIRPVDTRGRYYGEWDLVKVVICKLKHPASFSLKSDTALISQSNAIQPNNGMGETVHDYR